MLDEESKKDEQLLSDHPNLSAVALQSLRSTYPLQACRSAVSDAAERLRKSAEGITGISDSSGSGSAGNGNLPRAEPTRKELTPQQNTDK